MDQFGDENAFSILRSLPRRFTDRQSVRKTTSITLLCMGHFSPFVWFALAAQIAFNSALR